MTNPQSLIPNHQSPTYDWIVVGAGIAGAALAYELVKKGYAVLLLEQHATPQNATRYSYGGVAFWSGTTPLTKQLCTEGIARHQILPEELDFDTEFRELDLLLTIPVDINPKEVAASYTRFAISPTLLNVKEACELEPLLNPNAIAGALTVKHGHIHPDKTTQGYITAFLRAGGEMKIEQVTNLYPQSLCLEGRNALRPYSPNLLKFTEVQTTTKTYYSANTVVCAGGLSRQLFQSSNVSIKLYFTHAEMLETPPVDSIQLRTLVMPANLKRFQLETESSKNDGVWTQPDCEVVPPILDTGAIQFKDGSFRFGQMSRAITNPFAHIDSAESEATMREGLKKILPILGDLPGTWHRCLVSFSHDALPLVGLVSEHERLYVFSGFSNPFAIVPPLAQRFANWVSGGKDEIILKLCPQRL
ncbi:FAD-dependent oxidoreductase [Scytonema hofmannii PCC 7110]|uniref:FAD-dependent oxidoreductase n=1 Tax=Scytonema hofmannii PCC 7110 TaxID=128403 RepID=A0A139X156_9CYAN|nr:FAD-binding oxidoreductase [Scytonema hofmannii]KYC38393.1 FAD-dependent oxidoreductase [Scytonema hofmannii PCC 7110]